MSVCLLRPGLLYSFVAAAESSRHTTHRGARGRPFAGVACDSAADCPERRAARSTFKYMRLRRLILIGRGRIRGRCLGPTRIETSLFYGP